jgi:membrane-bound metal-dependent hydrolase YbcI (DUF457 family)
LDIITHTFSGLLFGTVVASNSKVVPIKKVLIIASGGFGGCLPDLDVISLWSGFDDSFGNLFSLSLSGHEIYFGKLWYSHHGFFHSLAGIAFFIFSFIIIRYSTLSDKNNYSKYNVPALISFGTGYVIHLFEDMPTPGGSWGGVNFFWPSSKWIGGTGQIWWWNNYDIFLIVTCALLINILLLTFQNRSKSFRLISISVFVGATFLVVSQIMRRPINFNNKGPESREIISLKIQEDLLGKRLFKLMTTFDKKVKVNF